MCWARQDSSSLAIGLDLKNQILGLVWHAWAGALLEGQGEHKVKVSMGGVVVGHVPTVKSVTGDCGALSKQQAAPGSLRTSRKL